MMEASHRHNRRGVDWTCYRCPDRVVSMPGDYTIKYTSELQGTWYQGRYADLTMAQMNARLCNDIGDIAATVVTYYTHEPVG